jgi:hypothetical protein
MRGSFIKNKKSGCWTACVQPTAIKKEGMIESMKFGLLSAEWGRTPNPVTPRLMPEKWGLFSCESASSRRRLRTPKRGPLFRLIPLNSAWYAYFRLAVAAGFLISSAAHGIKSWILGAKTGSLARLFVGMLKKYKSGLL